MTINSILDNDLYKFSMMHAVMRKFPKIKVKYEFINRGKTQFPEGFAERLRQEVKNMENLYLTSSEKCWFQNKCKYLDPVFFGYLQGYRFDSSEVGIIQKNGDLQISIEGLWINTILWEVPLMALISELYFKSFKNKPIDTESRLKNNSNKAELFRLNNIRYAEFGTRRRYSFEVQNEVIESFIRPINKSNFIGTSNVHLAHKYDITPIGTHAHEWFSFHAAKYGYKMANIMAMDNWVDVYRGDLGIALTDTFTSNIFFKQFEKKFSKLYDGVRHDSGNPYLFVDNVIKHYESQGIDPLSKTIVFSDGIDVQTAININKYCLGKIKCTFGIGTHFTNDVGVKPLNMVIKMVSANPHDVWVPTIKLSDDIGKHTGDIKEIEICKQSLLI